MKPNSTTKVIIMSLFLTTAAVSTSAQAGSRVKPPVADTALNVAWYQPVLEFFKF